MSKPKCLYVVGRSPDHNLKKFDKPGGQSRESGGSTDCGPTKQVSVN